MKTNDNYFETVYLGKKNDRVSPMLNKRLQKMLPDTSICANNKVDLNAFRATKPKQENYISFELLLEKCL